MSEVMEKVDVEAELAKVLNLKRAKRETDERWKTRLIEASDKLEDDEYETKFSASTQNWLYNAAKALKSKKDLPDFPPLPEIVDEDDDQIEAPREPEPEPVAKGRAKVEAKPKAEAEPAPKAEEPPRLRKEMSLGERVVRLLLKNEEMSTAELMSALEGQGVKANRATVQLTTTEVKRVLRLAREIGWKP